VLRLGNSQTQLLDLGEDRVGCGGPDKGLSRWVVVLDKVVDLGDEVLDALEGSPADGILGGEVEPDSDLIEPGSAGRGVVYLDAGASR
jgi:hypothetical protein